MAPDPPSPDLLRVLGTLGIDAALIQSCHATVRLLSGGLPVIDSLWIDALVSRELLTPLQARWIEAGHDERLIAGGAWKVTAVRHLDAACNLYDCRALQGTPRALLTEIPLTEEESSAAVLRIRQGIQSLDPVRDQLRTLPREVFATWNGVGVISPEAPGENLGRLLVRRGRFSEGVVREVALDLVRQLAAGEAYSPHGDVRLSNVILAPDGRLSLLNWGVLASLRPAPSQYASMPWDAADGFAPERWQQDRRPSAVSDIYSCGCLLWQLLAGRPPFLTADPLLKRLAHQSRTIPDVRTIAPETSPGLAELIKSMTSREPQRRPQRFAEIQQSLSGLARESRHSLREFSDSLSRPVTLRAAKPKRAASGWTVAAAALLLAVLGTGLAWNRNLLGLPGLGRVGAVTEGNGSQFVPLPVDRSLPSLPEPDAQGLVTLEPGKKYTALNLTGTGELLLRAAGESPAIILVGAEPFTLVADRVVLENCIVMSDSQNNPTAASALLRIQAQDLGIKRCRVTGAGQGGRECLVEWVARHAEDPRSCRLLITDSVLEQAETALRLHSPLTTAWCEQLLVSDVSRFLDLRFAARAGLKVPLVWNHCTIRANAALVSLPGPALEKSGRLSLQGANTVLDVGPGKSLLEIVGGDPTFLWEDHVEIVADSFVCPEACTLAAFRTALDSVPLPLESTRLMAEGLLTGRFHFEDSLPPQLPQTRLVIDELPVRSEDAAWGAQLERLPRVEGLP